QLPFLVVHELLVERIADAMRHAAMDLAFHDHWIDHPAAVVHHDVALDFDLRRLRVYLDHHRMHAVRGATAVRSEVRRSLETGLAAGRTAPRSGFALSASAPSATPRPESPRRCTRPPSSTRSASAAPSSRLASPSTFSRTATAAAWHALPATTAPRLAKVPVPQWNSRVSPVITCTSVTSTPRPSATT